MNIASREPEAQVKSSFAQNPSVSAMGEHPQLSNVPSRVRWIRNAWAMLQRFFWMSAELESATHRQFGAGQPGWSEFSVARIVLGDADHSRETAPSHPATLLLYRVAANLMMQAQLARDESPHDGDRSVAACWKRFRELPTGTRIMSALQKGQGEHVATCLDHEQQTHGAGQQRRQRRQAVAAMGKFVHAVASPMEKDARIARRVLIQRRIRIGSLAALLLIAMSVVVSMRFHRTNLALGRPVEAVVLDSTITPDPGKLVDGNRKNLGFFATGKPLPYVTIDLGLVQHMSRVVIYNRSDCCKEEAVPLCVEISKDLHGFFVVGRQFEPFSRWQLDFPTSDARYVRITLARTGVLHLSEVEIY